MPDMLVNLLTLPPAEPLPEALASNGITIRRAQPFELTPVRRFVEEQFALSWADEISIAFARQPVTLFIATRTAPAGSELLGFAAYECTRRDYFGPMGVVEPARGTGIGTALLIAGLHSLKELGYVYGIIGGVGPVGFYEKAVGARVIDGSTTGIYTDKLAP